MVRQIFSARARGRLGGQPLLRATLLQAIMPNGIFSLRGDKTRSHIDRYFATTQQILKFLYLSIV